jgi:hypothetical protein
VDYEPPPPNPTKNGSQLAHMRHFFLTPPPPPKKKHISSHISSPLFTKLSAHSVRGFLGNCVENVSSLLQP